MRNQMGWRGLIRNIKAEAPFWSYTIPKLPRIFAENLAHSRNIIEQNTKYKNLLRSYKYQNRILILLIIVCIITFWYKL